MNFEIIEVRAGQTGTDYLLDPLILCLKKKTTDRIWNEKPINGEKIFIRGKQLAI